MENETVKATRKKMFNRDVEKKQASKQAKKESIFFTHLQ